jgi:hypothetical protein
MGKKGGHAGKGGGGADKWLLSALRNRAVVSWAAEGVACFYRRFLGALQVSGARNLSSF